MRVGNNHGDSNMWHFLAVGVALLVASGINDPNVWWIVGFVVLAEYGWWREEYKVKLLEDKINLGSG